MKKLLFLAATLVMSVGAWAEVVPQHKHVYTIKGAFQGSALRSIYFNNEANRFKSANEGDNVTPQKFVFFSSPYTNNAGLETFKVGVVEGDGFIHYDPNNNGKVAKSNAASIAFPTSSTTLTSPVVFEGNGVAAGYNGMIGLGGNNTYRSYVVQNNSNINYNTRANQNKIYASSTLGATNSWQSNFLIEEVSGYDVYDVVFENGTAGLTVSYSGASECLTTTPQGNGGYFVLATGAGKTAADFNNVPTSVSVDEETKTITFSFTSATVTYNFKENGKTVESVDYATVVGVSMPTISLPFYTFNQPTGIVSANTKVDVDVTWNGPFVENTLYNLGVRLGDSGDATYYVKSDGTNAPTKTTNVSGGVQMDEEFLWSFERKEGSLSQFYLKNKKYGYINTNTNQASTMHETNKTAMKLYEYTGDKHHSGNVDFGFVDATNANQVFGDHQGDKLGYWNNGRTDNEGSAFQVSPVAYELEIGETGYSTLYMKNETLVVPEEVETVYFCELAEQKFITHELEGNILPYGSGVVVKAAPGKYTFNYTNDEYAGSKDYAYTLFGTGTNVGTSFYETMGTIYVFSKVGDNVGFYKFAGDTLKANRAFYVQSKYEVQGFVLDFGGEQTTGIESLIQKSENGISFDLQGRRVNANVKGISIQNGVKVIR